MAVYRSRKVADRFRMLADWSGKHPLARGNHPPFRDDPCTIKVDPRTGSDGRGRVRTSADWQRKPSSRSGAIPDHRAPRPYGPWTGPTISGRAPMDAGKLEPPDAALAQSARATVPGPTTPHRRRREAFAWGVYPIMDIGWTDAAQLRAGAGRQPCHRRARSLGRSAPSGGRGGPAGEPGYSASAGTCRGPPP